MNVGHGGASAVGWPDYNALARRGFRRPPPAHLQEP